MTTPSRLELEERKRQALAELAELDEQLAAGEIDPGRAAELRTLYAAEASEAIAGLAAAPDQAEGAARGWRRRALAGAAAAVVVVAGLGLLAGQATVARPPGGYVSGVEAVSGQPDGPPTTGRDLSRVSDAELEQAVAANPQVVAMRLALARRYFDRGEYAKASPHYLAVLRQRPDPEALSHTGWIAFQARRPDLAARLLDESLKRRSGDPEALWFLANVRLSGLKDPDGAVPLLTELLARRDLPPAVRTRVTELLQQARKQAGRAPR